MKNIKFSVEKMNPSQGVTPEVIQEQFKWRKSRQWESNINYITIIDIEEPVWWNRPSETTSMLKKEIDGLWSYNLPFLGNREDFKTKYNLLLNKNSIPVANHIKLNPDWTIEQINSLKSMMTNAICDSLIELGVDPTKLSLHYNDILFNGKKFVGYEQLIDKGVFTEDLIITLWYSPEEEIFQRLTGKYALTRGITGIIEETQCFTKEQLIEKLKEKILKFIDTLD